MINYGRQSINETDINYLLDVLKSDYLTQGPQVELFENELAIKTGSKFATAFNSATSALHVALLSFGVCSHDIVWVPAISFVSTANVVVMCGAKLDFVDVDEKTGNMSIEHLKKKLLQAELNNTLPKVLVVVHMGGTPCNLEEIKSLTQAYDIKILEDASHALGAKYKSSKIGSCVYSDAAIFSFHPLKMITTGEGGAITTNSVKIHELATIYRSHGIIKDKEWPGKKPWEYDQTLLGYNYRMPDLNAALGRAQLQRLDKFVMKRNTIAQQYSEFLKCTSISSQDVSEDRISSFHLFIIFLENAKHRRSLFEYLKKHKIITQIHYRPIYQNTYYRKSGFIDKHLAGAESYYSKCLSLPIYVDLSVDQLELVQNSILDWQYTFGNQ